MRTKNTSTEVGLQNSENIVDTKQDADMNRDPHSYDDLQFYQQLLKEFLESKGLGSVAVDAAVKVWSIPLLIPITGAMDIFLLIDHGNSVTVQPTSAFSYLKR